jgi:site-specific recombinase XerD
MGDRRDRDLSPAKAVEMYIDKRRADATDHTLQTYQYRLRQFVEWCEDEEIDSMTDIDGWTIEQFEAARRGDLSLVTLNGQMMALRQLIDYCARIGVVDSDLEGFVEPPTIERGQASSDKKLDAEDAMDLISFYRDSPANYGTVEHVVLELLWHVGFRQSALRALDLGDFDPDDRSLTVRHRPDATPLKNKRASERMIAIPEPVADVMEYYIERDRWEKRDDQGREPLITTRQGRASGSAIRGYCYVATQPCVHSPCPHGNDRGTCDWVPRDSASKCPSTRSPHQIRTGSITWQLNRGVPIDVVSQRADVTPRILREHYDKAFEREEMEERRREYVNDLDIQEETS